MLAYSLLAGTTSAQAGVLDDTVRSTVMQALDNPTDRVEVAIVGRTDQVACDNPVASLPYPIPARGGRVSVGISCDGEPTRYIQANVGLLTDYVVSTRDIAPGETITASMLTLATGKRDTLPTSVLTDPVAAIGLQANRRIKAGGYLQASSVKAKMMIARNAKVTVVASGRGFSVRHDGTALDGGSKDAEIRVRLLGGGIVKATVVDKNTVTIPL